MFAHIKPLYALIWCIFVTFLLYGMALDASFIFDDAYTVIQNPHLTNWTVFTPASGSGPAAGRPFFNATIALDHYLYGEVPWPYRLENCLIHALAGWLLFLICRRSFAGFTEDGGALSACIAFLWIIHPLQTESVTYISQRAESLAALFYLLSLYSFIRYAEGTRGWAFASILACLLGVATKETVATAPLVIFLYDLAFSGRTIRAVLQARWIYYLALLLPLGLCAGLIATDQDRGGTVGFGLGVSVHDYALTQVYAVAHYLWLCVHPWPLVLDYGNPLYTKPSELWLPSIVLALLVAGTLYLWIRDRRLGVAALAFFIILAPSSSFVPLALQTIAEHRMYLPLAALLIVFFGIGYYFVGRLIFWVTLPAALFLMPLSLMRNTLYGDPVALWQQTIANSPSPWRADDNLGDALLKAGRTPEAIDVFRSALTIAPDRVYAEGNLAAALLQAQDYPGALLYLQNAHADHPENPAYAYQIAEAYLGMQQGVAADRFFREAIVKGYAPLAAAYSGLGSAKLVESDSDAAQGAFEQAEKLDARDAGVHYNLAGIYWQKRQAGLAKKEYQAVLILTPHDAQARNNLGILDVQTGDVPGAREQFQTALRDNPSDSNAQKNLRYLDTALR